MSMSQIWVPWEADCEMKTVYSYMLSHFSCVWLFATLWTGTCQASLSLGILQAKILDWVAGPSSRGSSPLRDWTWVSCIFCITGGFFTDEPLGKPEMEISKQVYGGRGSFLIATSGRERMKAESDCDAVSSRALANFMWSFEAAMSIQNCLKLDGRSELSYICVNQSLDEGCPGKGT